MRKPLLKLILLAVCCVVPMALVWSLDYNSVIRLAGAGNYWFVAAIFAAFVYFAYRALNDLGHSVVFLWIRRFRLGILLVFVLSIFLQVNEQHRPKVLYDEDVICGVAYQMHEGRSASFPASAHYVNGRLTVLNSAVDKRPVFFPFVLSTLHDLTGYRTSNVYVLNAFLGFLLLLLLYLWAQPVAGGRGAAATLFLICTLPLLAQSATGAGFEVMNLCLIVAFALTARYYLKKEGSEGLDMMICVGLMLAVTRYESVLYLLALGVLVLFKWVRENHVSLTWFSAFSPLLLMSALVSNRVFLGNAGFMQEHNDAEFIAFSNLHGNLEHAAHYLLSSPWSMQTNSIFLTIVGVVSLLLVIVRYVPHLSRLRSMAPATVSFLFVLAVAIGTTFIGLLENWGQWDDPMAARFSLPLHLVMAMSFATALPLVRKDGVVPFFAVLIPAFWALGFTAPQNARHEMTSALPAAHAAAFFRDWANKNTTVRDLLVDESSIGLILEGHPSVSIQDSNAVPWKFNAIVEAGLYDRVFIFERLQYSDEKAQWESVSTRFRFPPEVKRQTVSELRLHDKILERISLVTHVEDSDADKHQCPADAEGRAKWLLSILP